MMYSFFKSNNPIKNLIQLVQKIRNNNLTISIVLEDDNKIEELSTKFWNMGKTIIHGIPKDGFFEMQPIILDERMHEKDTVIFYENVNCEFELLKEYKRVFFINFPKTEIEKEFNNKEFKFWVMQDEKWTEVSFQEY